MTQRAGRYLAFTNEEMQQSPFALSTADPRALNIAITDPNAAELIRFPFYPLDAPEMPLPGVDFIDAAKALGDAAPVISMDTGYKQLVSYGTYLGYQYLRAAYDSEFVMPVTLKFRQLQLRSVPGHLWGANTSGVSGGPRPAKVMLIGKMPGQEELMYRRNMVGPTSQILTQTLLELGVPDQEAHNWYITNLVKWSVPFDHQGAMPKAWVNDWLPVLHQELRLVCPDYILCLGSDASKALLGQLHTVNSSIGRVIDYKIRLNWQKNEAARYHNAKVMVVTHPAAVFRSPELQDEFSAQLHKFWRLSQGDDIDNPEDDIRHEIITTEARLREVVDAAIIETTPGPGKDPFCNVIAVDAEWDKEHPSDLGAYVRTIQVSWRDKQAICVVLREAGGAEAFHGGIDWAIYHLGRLLCSTPGRQVRVGGHFFRSDLPWLYSLKLDLRAQYNPATSPAVCRYEGGWDTSLMLHAGNETGRLKLEDAGTRLTTAPRWDVKLHAWRKEYCHRHKMKDTDLEGYGMCPGEILYPYGCYDVDVTRRIAIRHMTPGGMLDRDKFGNNCWVPYWTAHSASAAFMEMEMTGIPVDRNRVDELTMKFMDVKARLISQIRHEINWPDFNPESTPQRLALLFGDQYGFRYDKATKTKIPVRPAGAMTLGLTPIKSTGKRPKKWSDVVARNETDKYSPSTDKEVLGSLGYINKVAARLRDARFMGQALKQVLRPPKLTDSDDAEEEHEYVTDEYGNYVYDKGLVGSIGRDGRVRTHLFQTKETGRASSSRPPLQNISKRREDDYRRILGSVDKKTGEKKGTYVHLFDPLYSMPIRSILRASPGHVLVESDFTGAELAILAWMAQDPNMIEHVRRNSLPEDHPDHYDIHSQSACRVFNLSCPPTKKGMKDAGMPGLRVAAKNVNFGIPYGRGPDALARQCAEEGVDISVDQAQMLIDFYFGQYPRVREFLQNCQDAVTTPGWMVNAYGRYRRFMGTSDRMVLAEQQRQAQNFPIQSGVADAMNIALYNLMQFREQHQVPFRFLLQIHDAVLLEVPVAYVDVVVKHMMPLCMQDQVPFIPCRLDGTAITNAPVYNLGIDTEVMLYWGEKLTKAQAKELQLPDSYGHAA